MIIVCQVNRASDKYYEGTEREFDELQPALEFLMDSFRTMYGTDAEYHVDFWDPELQDKSSQLYSVELFAPGEDDGWYLFKAHERIH